MSNANTKAVKTALANADMNTLLDSFRFGFELETQSLDGMTCEGGEPEIDEEAYSQELADYQQDLAESYSLSLSRIPEEIQNQLQLLAANTPSEDECLARDIIERGSTTYNTLQTALNDACASAMASLLESLEERWTDRFEPSEHCYTRSEPEWNLPAGLTWTPDQSVAGPEIKVDSPNGALFGDCMKMLQDLVTNHELLVDTNCSFHVHVSVPEIEHVYGPNLQSYLLEYFTLPATWARVPEAVKVRLAGRARKWCKPQVSSEKMSFVHYHASFKTWEFRCFGNVSTLGDTKTCMQLAAEALQYAYRIQLGMLVPAYPTQHARITALEILCEAGAEESDSAEAA